MPNYDKLFVSLKYYLLGKGYYNALKALDFARSHHTGLRKDKVTPEFQHQIEICLYILTLKNVNNEELVITASLLHDVQEDYGVTPAELESKFGKRVSEVVWLLTKKYQGKMKDPDFYFDEISKDPVASIVKGSDRIHNVQSMVGVFTKEKQQKYLTEVEKKFLPMIKRAKYNFPEQTEAYFNIMHMLKSQINLIQSSLQE
jgi:(p)ppGpp synthase/HD superfamily hydrolase